MTDRTTSGERSQPLEGIRVLAALNGVELFGHERANIEVFKALRANGAEVRVGVNALAHGGAVAAELNRLDFPTFEVPFGPQWSFQFIRREPWIAFVLLLAVIRSSRRFGRAIRSFKPTHVQIGSPLVYSYICLALARTRVPVVYRLGDCPPIDSRFNLALWKLAMRRTTRAVANSMFVRQAAAAAGASEERLSVIANVAPSTAAQASSGTEDVRRLHSIIYVGAIAEHKGLIPLVDAVAALAGDYPDIFLDILGGSAWDGEFRRAVCERVHTSGAEGRVAFHGHVADPAPYFRRASVHVVPSLWEEPSANVVVEAKREGTPSVVFRAGGLPELVRHKVDGYICSDRTAGSIVEALRWLLSDDARLEAMRSAARADYEARFGFERFAAEWTAVYRDARNTGSTEASR